jgi:UDP-3-O-[3-hydroxymyristoyl] N-acetylglucosamine deacetylase
LLEQPDAYEIVTFEKVETAPKDYARQASLEWALT